MSSPNCPWEVPFSGVKWGGHIVKAIRHFDEVLHEKYHFGEGSKTSKLWKLGHTPPSPRQKWVSHEQNKEWGILSTSSFFSKCQKTLSNSLLDKVGVCKRVPSGGAAESFVNFST